MLMGLTLVVFYRLYYISQNDEFAMVSDKQSSYILNICDQRGMIYDCKFRPLVNNKEKFIASVIPTSDTIAALLQNIDEEDKKEVETKIQEGKPFLVKVKDYNIYQEGIDIISIKERYEEGQLAPHIIGYINGDGKGVCGIEKAYDKYLRDNINKIRIKYKVNALKNDYSQSLPIIDYGDRENKRGVVLTIDKQIQSIVERAGRKIKKGAIVVMDVQSGEIRGLASMPKYDPNCVERYLGDEDSPMLNRAFCSYNVGSTYKLLVSCAALEEDYNKFINFKSTCLGYKQISSNIFKCHFLPGHGTIGMSRALEISCNPYFIDLAINIGAMNILSLSKEVGFGREDIFAKGICTDKGSLPKKEDVSTASDVANLGFGQGKLMATPIQIAKMISMIANDGYLVTPKIVRGKSDKEGKKIEREENFLQTKIISTKTARTMKNMMISVVENGSGKNGKPDMGGAGGKTASAQTGHYEEINGAYKEIIHAWFAGFFPADVPKYVIVVIEEGGESGSEVSAPIFKEIADQINKTVK